MALPNLTTLERVKRFLELDPLNVTFDALLGDLLLAASTMVRQVTRRTWTRVRVVELYNGSNACSITLGRGDVSTVLSASIVQGQTLAASDMIAARQAIVLKRGVWPRGRANVTVEYECGFDEVPDDIQQAVCYLVATRYQEKDRIGVSSKGVGPETISFDLAALPAQVQAVLQERTYAPPVLAAAVVSEVAIP